MQCPHPYNPLGGKNFKSHETQTSPNSGQRWYQSKSPNPMEHQHPKITLIKNYVKSKHLIIPNVTPSKSKWRSQPISKYPNHKRVNDVKLSLIPQWSVYNAQSHTLTPTQQTLILITQSLR
jgi:hypothetical protein